jgi:hypothetical protein
VFIIEDPLGLLEDTPDIKLATAFALLGVQFEDPLDLLEGIPDKKLATACALLGFQFEDPLDLLEGIPDSIGCMCPAWNSIR